MSFHSKVNYLRISVTDRCNLACCYCVPKDQLPLLTHRDIARYEEILRIIQISCRLGITKVRITGGEPLVRRGIVDFIETVAKLEEIQDLSITTNGVLLQKNAHALKAAGLNRINISLDTLKPERFQQITGKDLFNQVWKGIMEVTAQGFSPIKLNTVIMKGTNDDEIDALAGLTLEYPFHIRFIEYMPMGNAAMDLGQQVLIPEIRNTIEHTFGPLQPVERDLNDGPARRFKIPGAKGEIGFISPVSSHFCHECNRLRLTSSGAIRPCLLNNLEYDILTPLRAGATDDELSSIIKKGIRNKPGSHNLGTDNFTRIDSQMFSIGG
ncbi:MoaA2 [Desulforapulum autotrophicum HRM2]|uniref:GTP 3',8-cyclase n=1 Tax=Desulforapulum autotrophicum (strain ATCC 43914 / DSM 3382 / VKM B-1955 / HRM2) TaxID=177437 RepID=C0Q9U4_DESAH|nr:GTP 3',8-cyclase MoaA [Desulforapulum autotrophicum]ACN16662.1 MoaA2 [Desulforapulum autotrophicum HRM2]